MAFFILFYWKANYEFLDILRTRFIRRQKSRFVSTIKWILSKYFDFLILKKKWRKTGVINMNSEDNAVVNPTTVLQPLSVFSHEIVIFSCLFFKTTKSCSNENMLWKIKALIFTPQEKLLWKRNFRRIVQHHIQKV